MNNILITSAGKRVSLTKKFIKELKQRFPEGKVYSTDMNPQMAPACVVSDGSFQVPRCTEDNYIDVLLEICYQNGISVVIPTIDTELLVLATHKDDFQKKGIHVLVSDSHFIGLCRDKRNTADFFHQHGLRVPEARDKFHPVFPLFAKPFDGSLSKDIHVIKCEKDMTDDILNNPKLIFMEYIDQREYKEYTVDMYYGRDNKVKSIVPRDRIEIRAGEINKGIARKNGLVSYLRKRLEYLPGVVGCICLQLFHRESDNDVVAIEINPRFGGGYPLSYCAGANYPEMIIKEYLQGENIEYSDDWRNKTIMLRYDDEVILYGE